MTESGLYWNLTRCPTDNGFVIFTGPNAESGDHSWTKVELFEDLEACHLGIRFVCVCVWYFSLQNSNLVTSVIWPCHFSREKKKWNSFNVFGIFSCRRNLLIHPDIKCRFIQLCKEIRSLFACNENWKWNIFYKICPEGLTPRKIPVLNPDWGPSVLSLHILASKWACIVVISVTFLFILSCFICANFGIFLFFH